MRLSESYEQSCITNGGARLREFGIDLEQGRRVQSPKWDIRLSRCRTNFRPTSRNWTNTWLGSEKEMPRKWSESSV